MSDLIQPTSASLAAPEPPKGETPLSDISPNQNAVSANHLSPETDHEAARDSRLTDAETDGASGS